MTPFLLFRLCLDFLAASLLLTAMVYYWTGNALHEVAGTAMFALLVLHNIFNRRWYGTITKGRREAKALVTKVINLCLLATMLSLLVTSVVISQSVFSFLPIASTITARQIHAAAAYVVLIVAALHLGLHWSMIMGIVRARLGLSAGGDARAHILRILAGAIALAGVFSLYELDVASKLLMRMSMEFGGFQSPTIDTIVHHVAIVGLFACLGHYSLKVAQKHRRSP